MDPQVEIIDPDMESRAEGGQGPGHDAPRGTDPMLWVAIAFVVLGFTPVAWAARVMGYGYFGPIAWPAILAMVGVLFAVIAFLRAVDTGIKPARNQAVAVAAVGLVRLFVLPLF